MSEQKLWFGRDYFGRRSLLWHVPTNPRDVLALTSVTERNSTAADTNLVSNLLLCLDFSVTFYMYLFRNENACDSHDLVKYIDALH